MCSVGDWGFVRKWWNYIKKFIYMISLDWNEQISDMSVNGWRWCVFSNFLLIKLHGMSTISSIDKQHNRQPWTNQKWCPLVPSCIAMHDWLRALMHLHCDITIVMSKMKTWCSYRSFKGDLPCLKMKTVRSKCNVNTIKICQFNKEGLKILGR